MTAHPAVRILVAVVAAAGLAAAASQAEAHARLVSAAPAANAKVAAPKTITLTFSEKLAPKFSGGDLMKADGATVAVVSVAAGKTVSLTLAHPLAPGGYMVMWHAVAADDGHRTQGSYNFTAR